MSPTSRRSLAKTTEQGSNDHVRKGILEAATATFAERGAGVNMAEIAEAAGVGRATLYRYFPNRETLLRGLVSAAIDELSGAVAAAGLSTVPVDEGLARLTRTFVSAGRRYAVLSTVEAGAKTAADRKALDLAVGRPIRRLLARGRSDGTLRRDLSVEVLYALYTGLLEKSLQLVIGGRQGVEQASAAITSLFLDGAAPRTTES